MFSSIWVDCVVMISCDVILWYGSRSLCDLVEKRFDCCYFCLFPFGFVDSLCWFLFSYFCLENTEARKKVLELWMAASFNWLRTNHLKKM